MIGEYIAGFIVVTIAVLFVAVLIFNALEGYASQKMLDCKGEINRLLNGSGVSIYTREIRRGDVISEVSFGYSNNCIVVNPTRLYSMLKRVKRGRMTIEELESCLDDIRLRREALAAKKRTL